MTVSPGSMAERLHALKSEKLDFNNYVNELSALADLSDRHLELRQSEMERLLSLRQRLRALELKVREMEQAK